MEIFLRLKNNTLEANKRMKRHVSELSDSIIEPVEEFVLTDEDLQNAREIIVKHDLLCKHGDNDETCIKITNRLKEMVLKPKLNKDQSNEIPVIPKIKINSLHSLEADRDLNSNNHAIRNSEAVKKREIHSVAKTQNILESVPRTQLAFAAQPSENHITDPCLERLLKQYTQARSK